MGNVVEENGSSFMTNSSSHGSVVKAMEFHQFSSCWTCVIDGVWNSIKLQCFTVHVGVSEPFNLKCRMIIPGVFFILMTDISLNCAMHGFFTNKAS